RDSGEAAAAQVEHGVGAAQVDELRGGELRGGDVDERARAGREACGRLQDGTAHRGVRGDGEQWTGKGERAAGGVEHARDVERRITRAADGDEGRARGGAQRAAREAEEIAR